MKKLVLAVCLMFGGAAFVNAQERDQSATQDQTTQDQPATQDQTQFSQEGQDQEGQQISVSELPEPVTAKLEGQDYSGWTVGNAFKKTDASTNEEMYVVELRRGTETKKVKFDSEGNKIDKKDKKDKGNQ